MESSLEPNLLMTASLPRYRVRGVFGAALLVVLVGVVDYFTGRELQVVPLYLLPVGLATWVAGRRTGLVFAAVCALVWLVCDLTSNGEYIHAFDPYWNAAGLLMTFSFVSWILSALRGALVFLEHKVELRTTELREEMLKRRLAEEARLQSERLAVVGTIAAQVAHEVRNPLGSMTLNMDLLGLEISELAESSKHSPEECHFLISQFRQELNRIKQVVDGYMTMARMPKLETRRLFLHDYLGQKLQLIAPELEAAKVQLVKAFDPSIPAVEADGDKLWQVLVNLIRNARQAMPDGGQLTVRTHQTESELEISVTDTGLGIDKEHLAKLFTPFFTTKTDGTGLGLVVVQQVISEMGGQITCQSVKAKGTTFLISFPLSLLGIKLDSIPLHQETRTDSDAPSLKANANSFVASA